MSKFSVKYPDLFTLLAEYQTHKNIIKNLLGPIKECRDAESEIKLFPHVTWKCSL